MNMSASECSSGCESGWTMYLDQSSYPENQFQKACGGVAYGDHRSKVANSKDSDNEEDLSMVSDASSGPPHFHEDVDCYDQTGCFCYDYSASQQANKSEKKKKSKEQKGQQHSNSYLDDTASSSHVLRHSKDIARSSNEGFSQGFSATHFKGKSSFRKRFGFLQSSAPGKQASEAAGSLQGRKWE